VAMTLLSLSLLQKSCLVLFQGSIWDSSIELLVVASPVTFMHLNFVHTKINHVGVDINNMRSNISVPAEYFLDNSEKERFESH
jgi:hypothetical protein